MNMRPEARPWQFAFALTLALAAASPVHAGQMYGITDLGSGNAYGIDNAGRVLTSGGLYQNGVTTPITLPGTNEAISAVAISPGGTLAYNQGHGGYGATARAYVLKDGKSFNAGTATDGSLAGGDGYSIAHAVNDAGAVAGESHALGRWNRAFTSAPGPDGTYHPVAMGANGGTISNATAINNRGVVVGWSDVAGQFRNDAFVGSPSHDIGTLGGLNSTALGINDKGQVVGSSTIATDYVPPPNPNGYYDPGATHAFLYQDGTMSDLGTLPGLQDSSAEAINALGQIVGRGYTLPDPHKPAGSTAALSRAALFDSTAGHPADLNDLLPAGTGWMLKDATGINDSGQIIGRGTLDGVEHSFLLTPSAGDAAAVPEPGTLAFAAVSIVVVGFRRRAKHKRCD